jgi:hypothetical protein
MNADRLEKINLEAAIIITGLTIYTSKESLYRETGWEKLSIRREQRIFIFILQNNPRPVS